MGREGKNAVKKIVFGLFFAVGLPAFSQTEMQISQYMFQYPSINPAVAGEKKMTQASLLHRFNWVGVRNAGNLTLASVNTPLNFSKKLNQGAGLSVKIDEAGLYYFQSGHLQYAYKREIMQGSLSAGVGLGFVTVGFKGDSVNLKDIPFGAYHDASDRYIPTSDVKGSALDINLGLWYATDRFSAGLSYMNLTQPALYWTEVQTYNLRSTLYATAAYKFRMANPKYVLQPSALFKTDFTLMQVDLSGTFEYDEKYWGGLTYRHESSVVLLAGMAITGGINLGYSFDIPISRLGGWGSHELFISYEFDLVFGKQKNKYKSIRIL